MKMVDFIFSFTFFKIKVSDKRFQQLDLAIVVIMILWGHFFLTQKSGLCHLVLSFSTYPFLLPSPYQIGKKFILVMFQYILVQMSLLSSLAASSRVTIGLVQTSCYTWFCALELTFYSSPPDSFLGYQGELLALALEKTIFRRCLGAEGPAS